MKRIGIVTAGLLCLAAAHAGPSWGDDSYIKLQNIEAKDSAKTVLDEARASKGPDAVPMKVAGWVPEDHPSVGKPGKPVEFVSIEGGKFTMGTTGDRFSMPTHEVTVKTFEISDTLVTVEQYAECVFKGKGDKKCKVPGTGGFCNWGKEGRQRHPINCVDWNDADTFARFKEARLLSEAEYEYAATSKGKNRPYPWGKNKDGIFPEPTCGDKNRNGSWTGNAVMLGKGGFGCGTGGTLPVCSMPAGNTAQGLCDIVGNVWEWMQDTWHDSYADAPVTGKAWEDSGSRRVVRGGSFSSNGAGSLRADGRYGIVPDYRGVSIGFRLARSSR